MFTAPAATLAGMLRCEATTDTGERLTLYGHCQTPQVALRMALESWQHDGVAVQSVKVWRGERAKGKPVLTWKETGR